MNIDLQSENQRLGGVFDVLAIFSLAVLPDLFRSFVQVASGDAVSTSFNSILLFLIVRSLEVSLPILLVMRLRNITWADYGFVNVRPMRDSLAAIGIAVLGYAVYYVLAYGLIFAGVDFSNDPNAFRSITPQSHFGIGTIALLVLSCCANGFAEELAMRSYLLIRLGELCGSIVVSGLLTTILFAAYHSYQGRFGIVSAFAIGSVFSAYFVATKRFWPIAIAHGLMDLIGLTAVLTQISG